MRIRSVKVDPTTYRPDFLQFFWAIRHIVIVFKVPSILDKTFFWLLFPWNIIFLYTHLCLTCVIDFFIIERFFVNFEFFCIVTSACFLYKDSYKNPLLYIVFSLEITGKFPVFISWWQKKSCLLYTIFFFICAS